MDDQCCRNRDVSELYLTIYGNGKPGLEMEVQSLNEWRQREEKRGDSNSKMLRGIVGGVVLLMAAQIFLYFAPPIRYITLTTTTTTGSGADSSTRTTTGGK